MVAPRQEAMQWWVSGTSVLLWLSGAPGSICEEPAASVPSAGTALTVVWVPWTPAKMN